MHLARAKSVEQLAAALGAIRADRLRAWLDVGVELGELSAKGGRYKLRGTRVKALADGDPTVVAHYRSLLGYQTRIYTDLGDLLRTDGGRDDLTRHAGTISAIALAAEPFVLGWLGDVTDVGSARRIADVGCGTGVFVRQLAELAPEAEVIGIERGGDLVERARRELLDTDLAGRVEIRIGAPGDLGPLGTEPFDLVTLINVVCFVPESQRRDLFEAIAGRLAPGGSLALVTMTVPGSVAAAHLDLMLRVQREAASLPTIEDLERDLASAGLEITDRTRLVPTEPFYGLTAARAAAVASAR